ncbi:MAG: hypothetical protein NT133_20005 [Alphaproteobacteria bacterium]|nr:hypothetical protein [Alphaproteobacteria bacterium]
MSSAGTLVLNAANTGVGATGYPNYTIAILAGTLELVRPDAGSLGAIVVASGTLRIDGTATIPNTINISTTGFGFGGTIDLPDIVATASSVATIDLGYALDIPTATSTYYIQLGPDGLGGNYLLQPDGTGGTSVTRTSQPVAPDVTIQGAGAVLHFPADPIAAVSEQTLLAPLNAAILAGTVVPFDLATGTPPSGSPLELITRITGTFTIPGGTSAFIAGAPGRVTVIGAQSDGAVIVAGPGGIDYASRSGAATIAASAGTNLIALANQSATQTVMLAGGSSTVLADGDDIIQSLAGTNLLVLGHGSTTVTSSAADTIIGGTGSAIINAAAALSTLALLGPNGTSISTGGAATVAAISSNDTITTSFSGRSLLLLGDGNTFVNARGADTILAGAGIDTVAADTAALIFAGSGTLHAIAAGGQATSTIVGTASGTLNVFGGSPVLVFANGATSYTDQSYGYGSATIISAGPALTVLSDSRGIFLGGSAGGNLISVSRQSSNGLSYVVAGGNNDTINTGFGNVIVQAGTGAETIIGPSFQNTSSLALVDITHGTVGQLTIANFNPGLTLFHLAGFAAGEAAAALAGATTANGNETLTLSDGTTLTFLGATNVGLANFV